jgi:ribonucleoside-diphosphate reductase alpha chain
MAFGLPYDSDAGRDFAGALTAILCGDAYYQSAVIAETCPPLAAATPICQSASISGGACPGFYVNREPFLDVIRMHRAEVNKIGRSRHSAEPFHVPHLDALIQASADAWDAALLQGERYGFRNSQVTVLAPTGTIGFMMDCDTTGVEPDLALVKYKKLVGGGMIKIVNNTVPSALIKLGYDESAVNAIVSYIDATGTIEGAPGIKPEHLAVFDCSFKPAKGTRSIHYMGHLKMMAAAQPFLSGAISKTVNLPENCSVEDIAETYMEAWRLGIKAVAIYRDNSKGAQPLNVSTDADKKKDADAKAASDAQQQQSLDDIAPRIDSETWAYTKAQLAAISEKAQAAESDVAAQQAQIRDLNHQIAQLAAQSTANSDAHDQQAPPRAVRHRLPAERASVTHKFALSGHEGYITVGLYPNGQPGEIFIRMAKEGSTVSGLMDSFATAVSLALQHGVPLKVLCEKFAHTRFEPSGWTGNEQIGYAKSIMDYLFRWIELRFLQGTQLDLFAGLTPSAAATSIPVHGTVSAPANTVAPFAGLQPNPPAPSKLLSQIPGMASKIATPHASEAPASMLGDEDYPNYPNDRTAPRGGIAPEVQARAASSASTPYSVSPNPLSLEDRGIYHPADAMKELYNMGDSPSCSTCGAIMTRSGSCYRCMSCGNTSGCS